MSQIDRRLALWADHLQSANCGIFAFNSSLSTADVATLDRMFTSNLIAAHAPNPGLSNCRPGVNTLVSQVDTASINPVFLATNDNAYILQLCPGAGPADARARAPTITKGTGHQVNPRVAIIPLYAPVYTGTYTYGATH